METAKAPVTVLIVDDDTIAREGLRAMLGTDHQIQIVGEAEDGEGALAKVAALHPQVALVDIRIPRIDGLEVTRRIKAADPSVAVIIVTSYDDNALVVGAVRAGASGYLLKDASHDLLIHTIGAVANGGMLIKASLLRRAIGGPASESLAGATPVEQREKSELTGQDLEILRLLAAGRTNRDIGDNLGLAEVTIKKHVQVIIATLHAVDRTDAAVTGLRAGLIQ